MRLPRFKEIPALGKFKQPAQRQFLKPDQPFPLNPWFKPEPPLSDKTRSAVYELYKKDAEKWNPRQLAEHFGVSIVRVQAMIKLKALEEHMQRNGQPLMHALTEGMEHMLGSKTLQYKNKPLPRTEPIRERTVHPMQPYLQFLEEDEAFTPNDAASVLKREPYENIVFKLDLKASKRYNPETPEDTNSQVLSKDTTLKGKSAFMFVDSSTKQIQVRQKDGTLRTGTLKESWMKKHAQPHGFTM
ncbi:eukaryotic mitochondrial regulator protein-domain-containing protein [Gorgonomyces haynaldii]|nr:eukaryotic mitochondrial regulator protein-domain-containing protein [Gorgonomyces haynaldii]